MRFWLYCLVFLCCPGPGQAGPWPRDKGATFLSFSHSIAAPLAAPGDRLDHYASLYLEHGLSAGLTLGLDAGIDASANHTAILFARHLLDVGFTHSRLAIQAGIGAKGGASGGLDHLLQSGLSWGRGLDTSFGPGWTTLDTSLIYNPGQRDIITKADLTVGLKPNERTKLMLQLQAGVYPESDPYLRLAPSMARKFGKRVHIELGGQIGLVGDDRFGVKLGTWLEF